MIGDRRGGIAYACVLEATAPKVGNVHPAARFDDLRFSDFAIAAEITAEELDADGPIEHRALRCIRRVAERCGGNVNLGIVLLLAPLIAAEEAIAGQGGRLDAAAWRQATADWIEQLTPTSGAVFAAAISAATAGGVADRPVPSGNVFTAGREYDLVAGMRIVADDDRIARQYVTGFADFFDHVVPTLRQSVRRAGDVLIGLADAHLQLLAEEPDSLIGRKNGRELAETIRREVQTTLAINSIVDASTQIDRRLRGHDHRLNPGTTADLLAAATYVLLRLA